MFLMFKKISVFKIVLLCSAVALTACTKSTSDPNTNDGDVRTFTSDCGTVFKGKLVNPIQAENGMLVTIDQIIGVDLASVTNDNTGESMLVKFQGISAGDISAEKQFEGRAMLEQEFGRLALFYPANEQTCEINLEGEKALIGQLYKRSDGDSYNEALLKDGFAQSDSGSSVCGGSFLTTCYEALQEEPQQQQQFQDSNNSNNDNNTNSLLELLEALNALEGISSGGGLSNTKLWKPKSESTGNVVVLIPSSQSSPSDTLKAEKKGGGYITFNARPTECSHNGARCHYWSPASCSKFKGGGKVLLSGSTVMKIPGNPCDRKEQ